MLTRLRTATAARDAGATLIELVVALVVSAIVATMAVAFFVSTWDAAGTATDESVQASQARMALQDFSQLIRVADSPVQPGSTNQRFVQIGPDSMTFYANLDNRSSTTARTSPTKVILSMAGGTLRQQLFNANADGSYPDTPTTSRLMLGCAANIAATACVTRGTVSNAAFTAYYSPAGCPPADLSAAGLCTVDLNVNPNVGDAVAVGFSFTVNGLPGHDGSSNLSFSSLASISEGNT